MSFVAALSQHMVPLIDYRTIANKEKIDKFVPGTWSAETIEREFQAILE